MYVVIIILPLDGLAAPRELTGEVLNVLSRLADDVISCTVLALNTAKYPKMKKNSVRSKRRLS